MKIALIKLSSLGDVVHALPLAASLRARHPGASITWVVEVREAAVLEGHPALDAILTVDTRGWRRRRGPGSLLALGRAVAGLRRRLRRAAFDVAVDAQGLLKSGVLAALTGARCRIGFAARHCREPLAAAFTNRRVTPPAGRHVVEQYLALLEPLGPGPTSLDFHLPDDGPAGEAVERVLAEAGLKPHHRMVVLSPGAGRPDKRWPAAAFGRLAGRLVEEAAAQVLVVWGPGEGELARAVVAAARPARPALAPPTDLRGLVALLRRASLVVAADTGPLHLAAALGRPCLGLYGPTRPERNGPFGPGHAVVRAPGRAMAALDVDPVFGAAAALLG